MANIAGLVRDAERRLTAAGVDDARLEAEVLLAHALGLTRDRLLARLRDEIEPPPAFEHFLARRLEREPLAYLTGRREFFGLDLECTTDALVPRQETELLVELALEWVRGQRPGVEGGRVLDAGTGNGAIAVAIAAHAPEARVLALDTSRAALRLARRNAQRHGVAGRIDFVRTDLLTALCGRFDVIVANLPYVSSAEYAAAPPEVRREPEAALHAGPRGTEVIARLLAQAPPLLAMPGLLLAEHAWDQAEALRAAARASFPHARIETQRDIAGLDRVLVVRA